MARLIFTDQSGAREFDLRPERPLVRVGRIPSNELHIAVNGISRQHAEFRFDPQRSVWTVADLDSSNGTWLNGTRVPASPLSHGDVLLIGECRLEFQDPRPVTRASAPPPPPRIGVPTGSRPQVTTNAAAAPGAPPSAPAPSTPTQRVNPPAPPRPADLDGIRAALERAESERDSLQRRCSVLTQEVQALREDLAAAPTEAVLFLLRQQLADETRVRTQNESVVAALRSQVAELSDAQSARASATPVNTVDTAHLASLTAQNEQLRGQVANSEVQQQALRRQLADYEALHNAWEAERAELMEQLSEHGEESATAATVGPQNSLLETELAASVQRVRRLEQERTAMAISLQQMQDELRARPETSEVEALQQHVAALQAELAARPTEDDLDAMRSRITTLTEVLMTRDAELAELHRRLEIPEQLLVALKSLEAGQSAVLQSFAQARDKLDQALSTAQHFLSRTHEHARMVLEVSTSDAGSDT
jgi:hypothetical protein